LRSKKIILQPVSKTTVGLWKGDGPVVAIEEADVSKLGESVLKALAGSREDIPHPTSWKGSFDLVLKAAGVKSWKAFVKSAKRVEIKFSTNRVSFVPTKNCGPRDGFQSLDEASLDCPPTESELTTTLFAAFEACR
jgi:hypothetical protein